MSDEMLTIKYTEILKDTASATLFKIGNKEVWLPSSQIDVCTDFNEFEIPEWLAVEKEIEMYAE